jgi:hypothetical protein
MTRDHFARELLADMPGGLRRNGARIDRVKVPACRQDVRHAPRRGAGRTWRHVAPGERVEDVVDLVGDLLERRHQRAAGEPQRRGDCVAAPAQRSRDDRADRSLLKPELLELLEQIVRERLEALDHIAVSATVNTSDVLVVVEPSARPRQQHVEVEAEGTCQCCLQPRHRPVLQPRQRAQRAGQRRDAAKDVQPVADLGRAQLAQVTVDVLDQVRHVVATHLRQRHRHSLRRQLVVPLVFVVAVIAREHRPKIEIVLQLCLLNQLPDLLLDDWQLRRIQLLERVVLVHEIVQRRQRAIRVRVGHRRHQVVDDHGVAAPLRLTPFTGIVDDERIDERDVAEQMIGMTRL